MKACVRRQYLNKNAVSAFVVASVFLGIVCVGLSIAWIIENMDLAASIFHQIVGFLPTTIGLNLTITISIAIVSAAASLAMLKRHGKTECILILGAMLMASAGYFMFEIRSMNTYSIALLVTGIIIFAISTLIVEIESKYNSEEKQ